MDFQQFVQWIVDTPTLFCCDNHDVIVSESPFKAVDNPTCVPYKGNPRLGFIYQSLCSQLFVQSDEFEQLAEEIQIYEQNKTAGAIDFIVKNSQSQLEHWEVAIKFYLLHDEYWYGPNAKDRLDKKLAHMLDHQLIMSSHPNFVARYPQWQNITRKLLIQGRLYVNPFHSQAIPSHCGEHPLNQSQINGFWCYQSQFSQIKQQLYILDKRKWAIGEDVHEVPYYGQSERFAHCQAENGDFWFVVPDSWPKG